MIHYIKEIVELCGLPFNEVLGDIKIIQVGTKVLYVGNYRKIINYGSSKIDLKIKNNVLHIVGENLIIKQINKNEMMISGHISLVAVGDYEKK
ncbi:MAG: hypothetical protein E7354_01840 [Clostridiales bacterium]|nr:hypothetical protein [Clostridiales bacterium]